MEGGRPASPAGWDAWLPSRVETNVEDLNHDSNSQPS